MFLPSNITLQFGDSGDFVTELQRRLSMVNCFSEDMVNGFYDGNTVGGVTRFQAMVGLHADGVAGPETLRRLNGAIAGDGGFKPEDKKEEQKVAATAQQAAYIFGSTAQQQQGPDTWGTQEPQQKVGEPAPAQPTVGITPPPEPSRPPEAAKPQPDLSIAAQFLNPTAAELQPPPREPGVEKAQQANEVLEGTKGKAQAGQTLEAAGQKQEPKTWLGRAVQFASDAMQRVASYIESKLSPSALKEVHEIGQVMAASGMKEAPIPTGPDMIRTPQTPAIGTGQAPQRQGG